MKIPLRYQVSEYDCGPTTLLNGLSFLFEREEIPPDIVRNIMLYSLDNYTSDGSLGKGGTSYTAMMFLAGWLSNAGEHGVLDIKSKYISRKSVYMGPGGLLQDCVRRRGCAVVRCLYEDWHYVLVTGCEMGRIYLFDPYLDDAEYESVEKVDSEPFRYNRIVPESCMNTEENVPYALGPVDEREAVLLINRSTELTETDTIEYFI